MTTTWTCGEKKVTIVDGIVTQSDSPYCVVGEKPNLPALRACGWKKAKTTAQSKDVWGRTISRQR